MHDEHCPFASTCDRGECAPGGGGVDRREFMQQTLGVVAEVLLVFGLVNVTSATGRAAGNERAYPIPPADGVTVDRDAQVLLVRYQGKVFALSLTCPHQNAAVRWLPSDNRFQCTKHDSKYSPDGTYMSGRATRNMDRLPIRKDGGSVMVDISLIIRADQNAGAWAAAAVAV